MVALRYLGVAILWTLAACWVAVVIALLPLVAVCGLVFDEDM